jgi:hypothetical protein
MPTATRIVSYGTAWVGEVGVSAETMPESAPEATAPQFSSPRLDSSFLSNFYFKLTGMTRKQLLESDSPYGLRRVGGSSHTSPRIFHVYSCSETLCQLLGALNAESVEQIARDWNAREGMPSGTGGRIEHRAKLLVNLANLAKIALERGVPLMLRVEYRGKA